MTGRERCLAERASAGALDCMRTVEGKRDMLSAAREIPAAAADDVLHAFCGASRKGAS